MCQAVHFFSCPNYTNIQNVWAQDGQGGTLQNWEDEAPLLLSPAATYDQDNPPGFILALQNHSLKREISFLKNVLILSMAGEQFP